jgi:hypothetical protein
MSGMTSVAQGQKNQAQTELDHPDDDPLDNNLTGDDMADDGQPGAQGQPDSQSNNHWLKTLAKEPVNLAFNNNAETNGGFVNTSKLQDTPAIKIASNQHILSDGWVEEPPEHVVIDYNDLSRKIGLQGALQGVSGRELEEIFLKVYGLGNDKDSVTPDVRNTYQDGILFFALMPTQDLRNNPISGLFNQDLGFKERGLDYLIRNGSVKPDSDFVRGFNEARRVWGEEYQNSTLGRSINLLNDMVGNLRGAGKLGSAPSPRAFYNRKTNQFAMGGRTITLPKELATAPRFNNIVPTNGRLLRGTNISGGGGGGGGGTVVLEKTVGKFTDFPRTQQVAVLDKLYQQGPTSGLKVDGILVALNAQRTQLIFQGDGHYVLLPVKRRNEGDWQIATLPLGGGGRNGTTSYYNDRTYELPRQQPRNPSVVSPIPPSAPGSISRSLGDTLLNPADGGSPSKPDIIKNADINKYTDGSQLVQDLVFLGRLPNIKSRVGQSDQPLSSGGGTATFTRGGHNYVPITLKYPEGSVVYNFPITPSGKPDVGNLPKNVENIINKPQVNSPKNPKEVDNTPAPKQSIPLPYTDKSLLAAPKGSEAGKLADAFRDLTGRIKKDPELATIIKNLSKNGSSTHPLTGDTITYRDFTNPINKIPYRVSQGAGPGIIQVAINGDKPGLVGHGTNVNNDGIPVFPGLNPILPTTKKAGQQNDSSTPATITKIENRDINGSLNPIILNDLKFFAFHPNLRQAATAGVKPPSGITPVYKDLGTAIQINLPYTNNGKPAEHSYRMGINPDGSVDKRQLPDALIPRPRPSEILGNAGITNPAPSVTPANTVTAPNYAPSVTPESKPENKKEDIFSCKLETKINQRAESGKDPHVKIEATVSAFRNDKLDVAATATSSLNFLDASMLENPYVPLKDGRLAILNEKIFTPYAERSAASKGDGERSSQGLNVKTYMIPIKVGGLDGFTMANTHSLDVNAPNSGIKIEPNQIRRDLINFDRIVKSKTEILLNGSCTFQSADGVKSRVTAIPINNNFITIDAKRRNDDSLIKIDRHSSSIKTEL